MKKIFFITSIITVAIIYLMSGKIDIYDSVSGYIKQNISELSPIKEQLGGKFYTTAISLEDASLEKGVGTVEYEDGHNAYTADFNYLIKDGFSAKVQIDNFVIRK